MGIQGAMFARGFGFIAAGASAAVDRRFAIHRFQEWVAAVGDTAANNAQVASLADRGTGFPLGVNGLETDISQPRLEIAAGCPENCFSQSGPAR
ncbi:MAG: hypothetical protein M3O30_06180 [Planctomycetota bacterium]|nr:hypothetical protein [Planctomycetota bacterium]